MFKKIIHRLLKHRHFWRRVGFDELSEIYVSMMFRSLSVSLTNIFVPLYMLQIGYSVPEVMMLAAWYFVGRGGFFDCLAGYLTARIGPKHTMLWSYLLLICSTSLFLTLPDMHWPLWLVGIIWGGSTSLFAIPFHVDFSKVKHPDHGGKELGYIHIVEKFGGIVGPLVGGLIATVFGGQYIFLAAVGMLVLSAIPLLQTGEPTKTHQNLNFHMFNLRAMKRDIISYIGVSIDITMSGFLWPLYLGVFVLVSGTAYARLGILASVSVVASMAAAFTIGQLIDKHRGRTLLRFGAAANTFVHIFRPFISTYPTALFLNTVNEGVTVAYRMPYTKGMCDAADDLREQRIMYFTLLELVGSVVKGLLWLLLILLAFAIGEHSVMMFGFFVAAATSPLIMVEKFKAL